MGPRRVPAAGMRLERTGGGGAAVATAGGSYCSASPAGSESGTVKRMGIRTITITAS